MSLNAPPRGGIKSLRTPAAVAVSAALLVWGVAGVIRAREVGHWRGLVEEAAIAQLVEEAVEQGTQPPSDRQVLESYAVRAEEMLFPPDYPRARRARLRALALEPFQSRLWFRFAQHFLRQGLFDQARAALLAAGKLDPQYPRQRIEAIQYWDLLGERDRSLEIARGLAELGPPYRVQAARELALLGIPPGRIFPFLSLETASPGELAGALDVLKTSDPAAMAELAALVPEEAWKDEHLRARAATWASSPPLPGVIRMLWDEEGNGAETIPLPGGGEAMAENPGLREPPFDSSFPFGWLEDPERPGMEVTWSAPHEGLVNTTGALRIKYNEASAPETISWAFHRLLIDSPAPVRIRVAVRQDPPERSVCVIQAHVDSQTYRSGESDWLVDEWQTLDLTVPASETAQVVTLSLRRTRRGGRESGDGVVLLGGISFAAPEPQSSESAGEEQP